MRLCPFERIIFFFGGLSYVSRLRPQYFDQLRVGHTCDCMGQVNASTGRRVPPARLLGGACPFICIHLVWFFSFIHTRFFLPERDGRFILRPPIFFCFERAYESVFNARSTRFKRLSLRNSINTYNFLFFS